MRNFILASSLLIIPSLLMGQQSSWPLHAVTSPAVALRMAMAEETPSGAGQGSGTVTMLKKPGLGLVMSAAVPGTGEMYAGSWVKGVVMIGAEVALWIGYKHYRSEGDRLDKEFRQYADENWIEADYWMWMASNPANRTGYDFSGVTRDNYQDYLNIENGLRDYEKETYSHSLHHVKDQQYYEMIGKYHQFREGWKDSGETTDIVTPLRGRYEDMEYNTDSMYKKAGVCGMVILANHVISALDAVYSVHRANHRIRMQPGFSLIREAGQQTPVMTLNVTW